MANAIAESYRGHDIIDLRDVFGVSRWQPAWEPLFIWQETRKSGQSAYCKSCPQEIK